MSLQSSCTTFLSLLSEPENNLKILALEKINRNVDSFWAEIANHLTQIESLYEDEKFPGRDLAAYVTSKVYYHLEEYDDSLEFALKSGHLFDINERSQYIDCMISKCIDKYVILKQKNYEASNPEARVTINPRLEEVVEKMLRKCINDGEFRQTIGIALESRRIDIIRECFERGKESITEILSYLFDLSRNLISNRKFRTEIVNTLIEAYSRKDLQPNDYPILCQCHFFLGQHEPVSKLLHELLHSEKEENILLAYQIAYDLSENENRAFINNIIENFPSIAKEDMEANSALENVEKKLKPRLLKILTGKLTEEINLTFLHLQNQSDPQVVLNVKEFVDPKVSVAHSSVFLSNSIIQSGTINDSFLRDNFEWVSKASNWSRFSLISSLGVVHKGNYQKAMDLLKPYLPGAAGNPNYHAHGGSLYALGLIHTNTKDQKILTYLIEAIKNPGNNQNEQIIHGACLGIGLVGMGSGDETLYEELKNVLYTNSAVTGEAAGIGIGLVMAGTLNENVIQELITYAHETDHEKIIRAIAVAMSMVVLGREEQADVLIEEACKDKDSILRYGAMFMIGMAYIGTGNNEAMKKLLHYASADVSDDVRRAAVISLSFLLINNQEQVPRIMGLLSMSYNPHVRYGTALGLGISCAGTCNSEAIAMLEPMLKDTVDFVRQAAFIGTAMILQQATEGFEPSVAKFRTHIQEIYSKKHEDILCKLGAILSLGILEAGGRNSIITLSSQSGNIKQGACLGMLVFIQFWYWFPMIHFLSLSLAPSAFIGVNINLRVPKGFEFKCNAKPSMFDYPAKLKGKETNNKGKTETVKLSTTVKAKARAAKKGHDKGEMELEDNSKKPAEEVEKKEEEEKKEEPSFHMLKNPSRVLEKQLRYISFVENRYKPIIKDRKRGLVFLADSNPEARDEYFEIPDPKAPKQELIPPEEFVFDEDSQKKAAN